MTRKEVYEQVVRLTAELAQTKVAEKIFSNAEAGDAAGTQAVIDIFPNEYPELYKEIVNFGRKFNELVDETNDETWVWEPEEDEANNIHVFDTNVIDSLSLYALTIFGEFDDLYLFLDWDSEENFFKALEEAGYSAFAEFVGCYSWTEWVGEEEEYATVGDLLVDVFAEEFEDDEPTYAADADEENE